MHTQAHNVCVVYFMSSVLCGAMVPRFFFVFSFALSALILRAAKVSVAKAQRRGPFIRGSDAGGHQSR